MDMQTIISIALNMVIIGCELWIFAKLKQKVLIFKYYTFLQNFIALIASFVFCVFAIMHLAGYGEIPLIVKGLNFTAACGMATTMFVYVVILAPRFKASKSEPGKDIFGNIDHKKANVILHYLCPMLAVICFIFFERQPVISDSAWTFYAAIPSIIYWVLYVVLTATHLWEEPYGLTAPKEDKKSHFVGIALILAIPASFVLISYTLFWLNLLQL